MAKRKRKSKVIEEVVTVVGWQTKQDSAMKAEMDALQSDFEALYRSKVARVRLIKTKVGDRKASGFVAVKRAAAKRKRGTQR
jgi:hypothetical protein